MADTIEQIISSVTLAAVAGIIFYFLAAPALKVYGVFSTQPGSDPIGGAFWYIVLPVALFFIGIYWIFKNFIPRRS